MAVDIGSAMWYKKVGKPERKEGLMMKAFTLLELLIVVIIIAVLVAIAAPSYYNAVEKAKDAEAKGALSELRKVCIAYMSVHGSYPDTLSNGDTIAVDMDGDGAAEITVAVPESSNFSYSKASGDSSPIQADGSGTDWQIDLDTGKVSTY